MKKIGNILSIILLSSFFVVNVFAGGKGVIPKTPSDSEIAKNLGIELQTLKDLNFNFKTFYDFNESDILDSANFYKETGIDYKQEIADNTKTYKDVVSGKLDLKNIYGFSSENEIFFGPYSYAFADKCDFIKDSKSKILGIGCSYTYSQDGMPSVFGYEIASLSKSGDHLLIKKKDFNENFELISKKKIDEINIIADNENNFNKAISKAINDVINGKDFNKRKNLFIEEFKKQFTKIEVSKTKEEKDRDAIFQKIEEDIKNLENGTKNKNSLTWGKFSAEYVSNNGDYKKSDKIKITRDGKTIVLPGVYNVEDKSKENVAKMKCVKGFIDGGKKFEEIGFNCSLKTFAGFGEFSLRGNYLSYHWLNSETRGFELLDLKAGKSVISSENINFSGWTKDAKQFVFGGGNDLHGSSGFNITMMLIFPEEEQILSDSTEIVYGGFIDKNNIYIKSNGGISGKFFYKVIEIKTFKVIYSEEVK